MAGLALLTAARAAGLTVEAEDEQLVIRGPRAAASLAQALLARKPCVQAALTVDPGEEFSDLRARLTCGCLGGYGRLTLPDGAIVFDVPGYARRRLADLADPRLSVDAAHWLRQLQATLQQLETEAGPPMSTARGA
jgi:hypothetical protein